jgi:hypothetical protein
MEYVHRQLHTDVTAIGGHYRLVKEARFIHRGREILYLVGHAMFETSCCGMGGCAYVIVPGRVVAWKSCSNEEGLAVSEVEPLADSSDQDAIRRQLLASEWVHQVIFL